MRRKGDPYLLFGENPIGSGVPFLPPHYAYLIKHSENVGIVEIYPWLAELMFNSTSANFVDLVEAKNAHGSSIAHNIKGVARDAINVVSINIGESMHNVADGVIPFTSKFFPSASDKSPDQTANFIKHMMNSESGQFRDNPELMPRNISIDTLGKFGCRSAEWIESVIDDEFRDIPLYARSSLVGAGNPMRLLRYLSSIGTLTNIPKNGVNLEKSQKQGVFADDEANENASLAPLNCIILNSLTNLARFIGFRDAMLSLRAMIERCIWDQNVSASDIGKRSLLERPGLFFAILGEGAFRKEEITFAETFFDGIIYFDAKLDGTADPAISYEFTRFPLVDTFALGAENMEAQEQFVKGTYKPIFSPHYGKRYEFRPMAGGQFNVSVKDRDIGKEFSAKTSESGGHS